MYRIAFFLFLVLAAVSFVSCKNDIQTVNSLSPKQDLPLRSAKDAELLYSDSSHVKVRLLAPVLDQYTGVDPRVEMPKGVDVHFFNEKLKPTTHLTANYAIRREKDNLMEARSNVVVVNIKGDTLRTEKLIWDERKRIIYTDVHVLITTASDDILEGEGLESNEDFSHYRIRKPTGKSSFDKTDDNPTNP
jgi:LPS export ABC transporter protein LptC